MLSVQQKCNSPRRNIAFRRGDRTGILHRRNLHFYGRRLLRGGGRRHILADLLRHSYDTLAFKLLCHVRSAVALDCPHNYAISPTTQLAESDDDLPVPLRPSRLENPDVGQYFINRSPLLCAGVGRARAANGHLPSEWPNSKNGRTTRAEPVRQASEGFIRLRLHITPAQRLTSCGVSIDLHRPLKKA